MKTIRLPPHSTFSSDLLFLNRLPLHNFVAWNIEPGMGFLHRMKWWGNKRQRLNPHEGLDIHSYSCRNGEITTLQAGTLVPVLYPGNITAIIEDFVAWTVIVRHEFTDNSGRILYTFYAHIDYGNGIATGANLLSGDAVGSIAARKHTSNCPAHLHLSCAWIESTAMPTPFSWECFNANPHLISFDPLTLINS